MSRSGGSSRRSGDPRKRADQAAPPPAAGKRTRVVLVAAAAGAGLIALAVSPLRPADEDPDSAARGHAEAACELTSKAEVAAGADTAARYAAATLLLDKAIIESARAAEAATEFAELDRAVQAVHTAAHQGSPGPWLAAVDSALAACADSLR